MGTGASPAILHYMPSKKHAKLGLVARRTEKTNKKLIRVSGSNKKPAKQPPDTSRIPWFPPLPKTGTDT